MSQIRLIHGDALEELRKLPDDSIDALVTDPPAGIGFMGRSWDSDKGGRDQWIDWLASIMREAMRVLKPGAHGLVWALPRTSHWTGQALEQAGFEIRDRIHHLFGSGFPKSLDISKALDKAAGVEREVVGQRDTMKGNGGSGVDFLTENSRSRIIDITAPATPDAARWSGWGTALKPAAEDWWLIRKPIKGTVAANVLKHGTGALNIAACRVAFVSEGDQAAAAAAAQRASQDQNAGRNAYGRFENGPASIAPYLEGLDAGRWPPNLLLTHSPGCNGECMPDCPVRLIGEQSGESVSSDQVRHNGVFKSVAKGAEAERDSFGFADSGTAARFFPTFDAEPFLYCPKPDRSERDAGCQRLVGRQRDEGRDPDAPGANNPRNRGGQARGNHHPTVKAVALMRWLTKLITPPGGTVLDCFMGSGSEGRACVDLGFDFIGIEKEADFIEIARARIYDAAPLFMETP